MAELYRFFNSTPDDKRTYQATDFAQFFTNFLGNGFFNGLSVTASDSMVVGVSSGSAMIEGHQYTNTDTKDLTVDGADSTNDRIDRVVLRLDANPDKRYIKAFIKRGRTIASPSPPDLERTDYIYELSLAQIRIEAGKSFIDSSQITDERGDHELMGRVQVARKIADQINTVDIKQPDDPPSVYQEGIFQFYMGSVNLPAWLDSMGIDAEVDYGVNESRLRAYAHTIANKTNTGVQEVTIFHANDYRIFGVFKRACNSINVNQWGKWHEVVFVSEEGENENGKFIKRSDGVLECWSNDIEVDITNSSGAIFRSDAESWEYPALYSEPPVVMISATGSTSWADTSGKSGTASTPFRVFKTTSGGSPSVSIYAVGRWR